MRSTAHYIWSLFRRRRGAENRSNLRKDHKWCGLCFCEPTVTEMWDFMDQRQLTVYNNGNNQMKMEKSPAGELVLVTLNHKKSHQLWLVSV